MKPSTPTHGKQIICASMFRYFCWAVAFLFLSMLLGCATKGEPRGIPTMNPLLNKRTISPTDLTPALIETSLPTPTSTPMPTPLPTATPLPPLIIYDDALNSNWVISTTMNYDPAYTKTSFRGDAAFSFSPSTKNREKLFFTVKEGTNQTYLRDDVLGLTFQIYSEDIIAPDDLGMFVIGSNQYNYYREDDRSVIYKFDPEDITAVLRFLGVSNSIPPNTWIWATNWLDDRIFAPNYTYIVGFYIMNEKGFAQTVLLDDIQLEMLPPATKQP